MYVFLTYEVNNQVEKIMYSFVLLLNTTNINRANSCAKKGMVVSKNEFSFWLEKVNLKYLPGSKVVFKLFRDFVSVNSKAFFL